MFCWTLLSKWYTPTECFVRHYSHIYRVLCWTLLSKWYTPTECFVRHYSHIYRVLCWTLLFVIHLQGVLLDIAGCVICIYSVLCWTLSSMWYTPTGCCVEHCSVCDLHLQAVVLNIAQCAIHTYRVLCWTLLSVWYTPTECFVRHYSHIYRVFCWALLFNIHLLGVLLDIARCVIYIYRVLCWILPNVWYTPTDCCVEHCSVCDIHIQSVVLNIAQFVI